MSSGFIWAFIAEHIACALLSIIASVDSFAVLCHFSIKNESVMLRGNEPNYVGMSPPAHRAENKISFS